MLIEKFKVLLDELKTEIKKDLDLDFQLEEIFYDQKYKGFYYSRKNWKHIKIGFSSEYPKNSDFYYEILCKSGDQNIIQKIKSLNDSYCAESTDFFPWSKYIEEYRNWEVNSSPWIDIKNGQIIKVIKEKIEEMLKVTDILEKKGKKEGFEL